MKTKRGNNEGSVFKRPNGKWRAQLTLNGGRLSFTGQTKREALDWLRKTNNQIDRGLTYTAAQMRFGEYLEEWVATKKNHVTQHSWLTYQQIIKDYISPTLGNIRLRDITPRHIQRLYDQKADNGVGLRTVQRTHTVLHAALNAAMKLGLISHNPARGARPPKPPTKEMQFLNAEQARKLLRIAKAINDRNYALYYIALVTGMREGELLALRWEDVNLETGALHIRFNLKRVPGGGLRMQQPKTKSSIRTIKLGQESVEVLRQQKEWLIIEKANSNGHWQDTSHVFPSTIGTPLDPSNMLRQFRELLEKAELPRIRFHDLRHTAASLMLNNGVDVIVASQRLGHAKPSITLDVYGHLIPNMQNHAAEMLDTIVQIEN